MLGAMAAAYLLLLCLLTFLHYLSLSSPFSLLVSMFHISKVIIQKIIILHKFYMLSVSLNLQCQW